MYTSQPNINQAFAAQPHASQWVSELATPRPHYKELCMPYPTEGGLSQELLPYDALLDVVGFVKK